MKNELFFPLILLASNLSLFSMEQQPKTIVATLLKLQNESEWPQFENFQTLMHQNKEAMISTRFGEEITHYCKTNSADANVQLLNRWIELRIYDQILKTENPDRSLPHTLHEMWYLEHGSQLFPYEGIVTKLCRSGLKADFEKLVVQTKENIDKKIKAKQKE